jgi:hypothetical protein
MHPSMIDDNKKHLGREVTADEKEEQEEHESLNGVGLDTLEHSCKRRRCSSLKKVKYKVIAKHKKS